MVALSYPELMRDVFIDHKGVKLHVSFDQKVFIATVDVVLHLVKLFGLFILDPQQGGISRVVASEAILPDKPHAEELPEDIIPLFLFHFGPFFSCKNCRAQGSGGTKQIWVFQSID